MLVLVTYDVQVSGAGGAKRLRQVAKACRDYGQRVQFSVFEIEVEPAQWVRLKARLEKLIDPAVDSLRYYQLGANWERKIEHVGAKPSLDLTGGSSCSRMSRDALASSARTPSVLQMPGCSRSSLFIENLKYFEARAAESLAVCGMPEQDRASATTLLIRTWS